MNWYHIIQRVGSCYANGDFSFPFDITKALELWQQAGEFVLKLTWILEMRIIQIMQRIRSGSWVCFWVCLYWLYHIHMDLDLKLKKADAVLAFLKSTKAILIEQWNTRYRYMIAVRRGHSESMEVETEMKYFLYDIPRYTSKMIEDDHL